MKASLIVLFVFFFSIKTFANNCSEYPQDSMEFLHCTFECEPGVECKRFSKSMRRDSLKNCFADPENVFQMKKYFPELKQNMTSIRGKVFYADIVGGPYGYWMYSRKNHLIIHTTVHFSNFHELSDFHQQRLRDNFKQAAQIWKEDNPFNYKVHFAFQIVDEPEKAHVRNIKLMSNTRGPYYDKWNINWSPHTIAHEFGHVLGLDDEYSYFSKKTENICEKTSFMCRTNGGGTEIKSYHYYMVFRRLFCQD